MIKSAAPTILLSLASVLLVSAAAFGADFEKERLDNWSQWRGPEANGTAPNGNPPLQWDEDTNIKWKVPIPGGGDSSPIVWGDQVIVLTAIKTDRVAEGASGSTSEAPAPPQRPQGRSEPGAERIRPGGQGGPPEGRGSGADRFRRPGGTGGRGSFGSRRGRSGFSMGGPPPTHYYQFDVISFDRNSGKIRWQKTAAETVPHESHHATAGFANGSPITDGKRIIAFFGSRGIYCYDMQGGLLWDRDLGEMRTAATFGEGASPALHGETVVVNWDHEGQSFITALDAKTGEQKWKVDRDERTTWNTPLIVEHGGRAQVVVNGANRARGYDLETGEMLWACGGQTGNPIPSAVALNGIVFCMTGFRAHALFAIPLDSTGDITGTDKIAWSRDHGTSYAPSPLLYGDRLYFTQSNKAILTCLDAMTGETLIEETRLPDLNTIYSSPVGAAGRIYFTDRGGTTVVIKNSDEFEILATNKLDDEIDSSPAIAGGEMFIRGAEYLYCIAAAESSG